MASDVERSKVGLDPDVEEGQSRLHKLTSTAVETLERLMTNEKVEGYIQLGAANSTLDRVGLGKKSTVDHHHEVTHGLDPQIEQMLDKLRRKEEAERNPPPQLVAPQPVEVVGEFDGDEVEDAEIVDEPTVTPPQSVVLNFEDFVSRPPE